MSQEKIVEIDSCIEYWKSVLLYDKFLLPPSVQVIVEATLNNLKYLKSKLGEDSVYCM